jgi:hypothetical protein
MKTSTKIILLFISFLCSYCNQADIKFTNTFPKHIKPLLKTFDVDTLIFSPSGNIDILADHLLFYNIYGEKKVLHIYDLENGKYLRAIGDVGDGPNEISQPGFINIDKSDNSIYISDPGKSVLHKLSTVEYISTINYPREFSLFQFHSQLNNGDFITNDVVGRKNLIIRFNENKIIDTLVLSNLVNEPLVTEDFYKQLSLIFNKHPFEDKIICAYRHYDLINIIDLQTSEIIQYRGPLHIDYSKQKELLAGYRWPKSSNKYIYAQFVGGEKFILHKNIPSINYAKRMFIFDWNAKPVAQIEFDVPIISFGLDSKRNRIILLTENEETPFQYFNFMEDELDL